MDNNKVVSKFLEKKVKLCRWGRNLGFRIPGQISKLLKLRKGSRVLVTPNEKERTIVIKI